MLRGKLRMFEHGSEILKADFHLHTIKDKEFKYAGQDSFFVSSYIDALSSNNIHVGVITNHNKFDFDEYTQLRKTAKRKDILILPGVELSVKEGSNGLHLLIVFNPDEWLANQEDHINQFLNAAFVGINNRENANQICNYDFRTVLDELEKHNNDYFIVFAHAEQSKGLLYECKGGVIKSLASLPYFRKRVLGIQKIRTHDNIENLKKWIDYDIAFIEGSDPKCIEDIGKNNNSTYIKIGELSYAAVKFALLNNKNRIFQSENTPQHSYIYSITFQGSKLNQTIYLSKNLNTLIGIRGSGKSSIIEALRYSLQLDTSKSDKEYKDDLVKNVLGSGGKVILSVIDEHGHTYKLHRILGEMPSILDDAGKDLAISISSIIKNPLYFGQKDLAMTQPGYEHSLLDQLMGKKISSQEDILKSFNEEIIECIKKIQDISNLPNKITELEEKNRDLNHKLKIFTEKGIAERLEKEASCSRDSVKLEAVSTEIKRIKDALDDFLLQYDSSLCTFNEYESKYNSEIFKQGEEILNDITNNLAQIAEISKKLDRNYNKFEKLRENLDSIINSLKENFAELKREIQDDTLDPDSFVKYSKELDKNTTQITKLRRILDSENTVFSEFKSAIRKRNDLLKQIYDEYCTAINRINKAQTGLNITITFKGNKNIFIGQLKEAFKGTRLTENKYTSMSEKFSDFVAILEDYFVNDRKYLKELLSESELTNVGQKLKENFEKYASWTTPNLVEFFYHGQPLNKHSLGQRASALILFILSQQDNDIIIIDQPEDDLDNKTIYNEFIKTIGEKKPFVQFIFATHNANIPVLGDAEKIIATAYSDNKINTIEGSIDTTEIQKEIVNIMEGGYEAFQRRNAIYTAWQQNKNL
jgi:hypothetical protein